jgi:formylglycine-generating enzyme required for sulfatase activity
VSWNDASAFCAKLTERERAAGRLPAGYEYRLPTEAEWEYAARGGAASKGYTYAGSNNVDEVAWYDKNSGNATHPVGKLKANEVGLYDMSGNVWEWCLDWYDGEYYGRSPNTDPANTSAASYRVFRGGSWGSGARNVRSARRYGDRPGRTISLLGFRACLAPQSVGQ